MATSDNRSPRLIRGLFFSLTLIAAASMLYYHEAMFIPRAAAVRELHGLSSGYSFGNDFYQVWVTSRESLRHRANPYSPEMTRRIQAGLYGRPLDPHRPGDPIDQRAFPYPAFTLLLFAPVAEIAFEHIRVPILCALIAFASAAGLFWMRTLNWHPGWKITLAIILLTLCSYPALEGLYSLQLGLLVIFLLAASIVALQHNRLVLGGILMALTTMKPQITALVILYLLLWSAREWRSRWQFMVGLFSALVLLVGGSLALWPHWIQSWIHILLAYRHYTQPPLVTEVITPLLGKRLASPATLILTALALMTAAAVAWRNHSAAASSKSFMLTVTLLLAITTVTLLPGQAVYDHLSLVPGILLLVRDRHKFAAAGRIPRALLWIGGIVLFWPWIAACGLTLTHPWLTLNSTALSLPIRTASSLPFVVLALLALMYRFTAGTNQEHASTACGS